MRFAITHENFTESLQHRSPTSRFLFRFFYDCTLFLKMFEVLEITIYPILFYREDAEGKCTYKKIL